MGDKNGAKVTIDLRSPIIKRKALEIRRELPNQCQTLNWLGATTRAEIKFRLDDCAQQYVSAFEGGEAGGDTRLSPPGKSDADVGVEQLAHNGRRSSYSPSDAMSGKSGMQPENRAIKSCGQTWSAAPSADSSSRGKTIISTVWFRKAAGTVMVMVSEVTS